jgi:C-terminal processing protease CtpA/Prc
LYVLAVTIDGPADLAGVQPGDELLTIDGAAVAGVGADNAEHLLTPANIRRGQSLMLELERDGGRQTLTVEASAPPDDGE